MQNPKGFDRNNKALNRIVNANANFNTKANDPDWSHPGQLGRNPDSYNIDHNEDRFFVPRYYLEHARNFDTEIEQNVAYLFKDDVVLKYDKVGNSQEVMNEPSNIIFAPANNTGLFKVGVVPYGIEICRNPAQNVLAPKPAGVLAQLWGMDLNDQICGIKKSFSGRLTSDTMLAVG